jgi:hypothetical protein
MQENECKDWMKECLIVFPEIKKKKIEISYKKIISKKLGYVSAKIEKNYDFNPEELLLGKNICIKEKRKKPKEFKIYINDKLVKIKNIALRKEIVQNIIIHELLHIANDDLFTLSKNINKRKKKKIHVNHFEEQIFKRYNKLREIKGIMQIQKKEHLDIAISRILESINWFKK